VSTTSRQAVEVAGGNGHENRGVHELKVAQDLLDEMCPRDLSGRGKRRGKTHMWHDTSAYDAYVEGYRPW